MSYDEVKSLVVFRFSGQENSDADYASYCESMIELNKLRTSFDVLRIAILTVDSDNPLPNASWRRKIAKASEDVDANTLFILVSERAVVRGIVTALNWVRPPTFQWSIASSFEEALEVVAELRPDAVLRLRQLLSDCEPSSQATRE